jgi:tetratricopeptide (TPR) repeat protein
MELWQLLEISPTEDETIIKRAYAKKLKLFHPEDDPDGYQKLREAYDSAIRYAKAVKNNSMKQDYFSDDGNILEFSNNDIPINNSIFINMNEDGSITDNNENNSSGSGSNSNSNSNCCIASSISEFIEEVNNIYKNYFSRIELKNWEVLMNFDVMWDINDKENLNIEMLNFLMEHHQLPQNVWKLLDSYFNWTGNEEDLSMYYAEEFIHYIYSLIHLKKDLNYACFKSVENIDYDKFFENRENAYLASVNEHWEDAASYIKEAKQIYDKEADILYIEILKDKATDHYEEALIKCNELLALFPDYADALYERGKIHFHNKLYEKALKDCLQAEILGIKTINLYQLIAISSHEQKDYYMEKEYYSKVLIAEPEDDRVKNKIIIADKKIRQGLLRELIKHAMNKEKLLQYRNFKHETKRFNKEYNIKSVTFGSRPVIFIGTIFWVGLILCIILNSVSSNTNIDTKTSISENEYLYGNFELDKVPNDINVSDIKFSNIIPLDRVALQTTEYSEPLITPIYRILMLGNFRNKIYILAINKDLENNYKLNEELHYSGDIKTSDNYEIDLPTNEELTLKLNDTTRKKLVSDRYLSIDNISENTDEGSFSETPAIFLTIGGFIVFVIAVIRGFQGGNKK